MSKNETHERPFTARCRTFAAALLGLAACSGPADAAMPCSATEIAGCRESQQGCALEGGAAVCSPCAFGHRAGDDGLCAPIVGQALTHAFPEVEIGAGEERSGTCRSWTLGNETELWVSAVELVQDEASHHSNWTFVQEGQFDGPDGTWRCDERGYDQLSAAVAGGVLYAQSTQAAHEVQQLPEGAAIRLPPHARIISDIHQLNLGSVPVRGRATLTLYTRPRADVLIPLTPFHIEYHALDIAPRVTSRFTAECALETDWQNMTGQGVSMRLFYALPHTHALGSRVFLQAVGGPRDGEMLLDVRGYNGEARGRAYDPPVDLTGITGLRFGCEFDNPRAERVGYGIGDQEMCEMLGFIESDLAFESRVTETSATGLDGDVVTATGSCSNFLIPWASHHGTP